MVFSSETFLFLFLPLFLALYYVTPERHRNLTILVGSYAFYAWWRVDFVLLLFLKTLWTFVFGILIEKHSGTRKADIFCAIGIIGCLIVLGVFKYLNFFVDSFAAILGTTPADLGVHWRLILPIGISFFIFQAISYLIDVSRKEVKATRNFLDFAAFVALFPQLIAGPILRFKDLEQQFVHREHSFALFSEGVTRFAVGLAKKVLLADAVAPLADAVFAQQDPDLDGILARSGRLHAPALFRFLRLQRHGDRPWHDAWVPFHRELQHALSQPEHHGVLAPLAHEPVLLAARLSLHPARRQPRRYGSHLCQPDHRHDAGRTLAWRQLDVCALGPLARRLARRRAADPLGQGRRGEVVFLAADASGCAGRLGHVPRARRRQRAGRLCRDARAQRHRHPPGLRLADHA